MRCEVANVNHICHTAIVSAPPPVFEPPRPYNYKADAEIHDPPQLAPSEPSHSKVTPPRTIRNCSRSSACSAPAKDLGRQPGNDNALGEPAATKSERKVPSISYKIVTKVKDKDEEKRPNKRKRKSNKSHFVYYVQTNTKSPFDLLNEPMSSEQTTYHNRKDYDPTVGLDDHYSMYNNCDMNERYIAGMVRKQYEHYPMGAELSDTSDFSTPVCRDPPRAGGQVRYDSDVCSCCHGPFHNVDDTMRLPQHGNIWEATSIPEMAQYAQHQVGDNSVFYDSSFYDVVPVKEMPTKQRREDNVYINHETKRFATLDVCPIKAKRAQPRKQHNHYNVTPLRVIPRYYAQRKKNNSKVIPQRKDSLGKLAHLRKTDWRRRDKPRPSEVNAVDCSPVYTRPICTANISNKAHMNNTPAKTPVEVKNVECLTTSVNNSQCQTASTKSVQLEEIAIDENKTEVTLNQIKTILQSVLTEVKTSSQMKNLPERIPKKDAIVQKGQSQNNMETAVAATTNVQPVQDAVSSFINYSYSPYNLKPYGPSCSRQVFSSQLATPVSPFQPKCMHNYPLFIQTTGQCACCFRSIPKGVNTTGSTLVSNAPPPLIHHPLPATIATNTEQHSGRDTDLSSRSPETDKLIQEIYKSIAVNMDYFTKNSTSDYTDIKSSNPSQKTTEMGLPSINERKKQVGLAMVQRQSNISSSDHSKSVMAPVVVSKTTLSTPRHSHRAQSFIKESTETKRRELTSLRRRGGLFVRSSSSQSDSSTITSNASGSEKTVIKFADQVRY